MKRYTHKDLYADIHGSITDRKWKQSKCPSTGEWINKTKILTIK
jgi:hypothetical protein